MKNSPCRHGVRRAELEAASAALGDGLAGMVLRNADSYWTACDHGRIGGGTVVVEGPSARDGLRQEEGEEEEAGHFARQERHNAHLRARWASLIL